jgi:hypothetical protein
MKKGPVARAFFLAARSARLVLLALLTLFVAVCILLAGLTLLVRLALLLAGLLARLRLVLALGLLVVLTRLIVLVRHIVLQGVGCPQPLVNPCLPPAFRKKAMVPKVSSWIFGHLHKLVACAVSRPQHGRLPVLARQFDWRGTRT